MFPLPTIKIKHPDGFAVINEADFDPAQHEVYRDPLDHDGDGKKGGSVPKKKA
jgi:hypothetical protein